MITLANCLLLGLAVIGAARVAHRDQSGGWSLMALAVALLLTQQLAGGAWLAVAAHGALLAGLVTIYHGHRDRLTELQTVNAIKEAALRREVNETIQRLDRAQRQLAGND